MKYQELKIFNEVWFCGVIAIVGQSGSHFTTYTFYVRMYITPQKPCPKQQYLSSAIPYSTLYYFFIQF
jgi:hypothetical protein